MGDGTMRDALERLPRYAMVGNLNDRHMEAAPDGEYILRSAALAARSEAGAEGLREAVLRAGTLLTEQHGESCDCSVCLVVQPLVDAALAETFSHPYRAPVVIDGHQYMHTSDCEWPAALAETEPKP